jgi:hypothetical protein
MGTNTNRPSSSTVTRNGRVAERYRARRRIGGLTSLNATHEAHNAAPTWIIVRDQTTHPVMHERELAALENNAAWCRGIPMTRNAIQNYVNDGALAFVDLITRFVINRECHAGSLTLVFFCHVLHLCGESRG